MDTVDFRRQWSDVLARERSGAQGHVIDGYHLATIHAGPERRVVRTSARSGQAVLPDSPNAASETRST